MVLWLGLCGETRARMTDVVMKDFLEKMWHAGSRNYGVYIEYVVVFLFVFSFFLLTGAVATKVRN